jgi:hypothetical protein
MNWQELLTDAYNRIPSFLGQVLDGLPREKLDWSPHLDTNSIGWLAWHLARQQDAQVSDLMREEQLWTRDGWHARFGRPEDPGDIGFGQAPKEAAAFKSPEAPVLLDYIKAVTARSTDYFTRLTEAGLDRKLDEPQYNPLPTVGVRLVSILDDCALHAGQAAYIRGLIEGYGWQKY